ncbi:MAG TPA: YeeE/YedE thiosulfate transporter family protein [Polyangiaceae bacterium]|nr:YeeE/YedE thiosulfate transporter family protein [Polyangiaceae bacterium]
MTFLPALGVGFAFGFLLQKAGLARYERIVRVFVFQDLTVLKFLLSALVVGAVGVRALIALDVATSVPVPATFPIGNAAGGVLFGAGMALSGFCPGTIAAGVGEGRIDYLVAGVAGLVAGALGFGLAYPVLAPLVARGAVAGLTLPDWLDLDPWLVVILFMEMAGLLFYLLERGRSAAER